ncbi:hypothetical protein H5410_009927 [Solanum commersonii]|uniref:Phospholipid/glycerol acyltransferase domain-containing protein n=1 Tax=Solanum commersonii TaxID=4109 RepID=A0A9J6AJA4_SOLCO|nr:hypothetical protein H5410_009927 [Solanum commersonii]
MLNVEAPNWSWMDPTIFALNPFKNTRPDASSRIRQNLGTGTFTCFLYGYGILFPIRILVELICSFFVASSTGVVKYHRPRPKQVFVANHTSMIDFVILEQMTAFAVIMQKHSGWVGKRSKAFGIVCSFTLSLSKFAKL